MKENKRFKIDVYGLKNGVHEYDFEIDQELFENFEDRMIDSGNGACKITLVKKETMMELTFEVTGTVELTCDRSNDVFDYSILLNERLIVKYGEEYDDAQEDLWVIPETQQSINIQQPLYEFISLSIPMKKLHPRFEGEEENDEEVEWVYSSEEQEEPEVKEDEIDPRWAALKNIKKD